MNLHLQIDHVVVHGLDCPGLSRSAIESHLLSGLQTQLEQSGVNFEGMQSTAIPSLKGPARSLARHASPIETGHAIAASLNSLVRELAATHGQSHSAP